MSEEKTGAIVLHIGKYPVQHRVSYRDDDGVDHPINNVTAATIQVSATRQTAMTLECFVMDGIDMEVDEAFVRIRERSIGRTPGLRAEGV